MREKSENRGKWAFIGKMVNFGGFNYLMNSDSFQLEGGSGFWRDITLLLWCG